FARLFKLPIRAVVAASEEWLKANTYEKEPGYPPIDSTAALFETHRSYHSKHPERYASAFVDVGSGINSANAEISLNGFPTAEAKQKITAWLEVKGFGKKTINYKLRDWLFSRQRYWGEPFPIVWKKDANGNAYHQALPESALPLLPPALDDYKPTPDGQPPLARAQE